MIRDGVYFYKDDILDDLDKVLSIVQNHEQEVVENAVLDVMDKVHNFCSPISRYEQVEVQGGKIVR